MMLKEFQKNKKTAFVPFVVAGEPSLGATEALVEILVSEGADIIELGLPFSDAMADGPVIQRASERAAKRGVALNDVFELATTIKKKHPSLGLVIFSYYNPIMKAGLKSFASRAKAAGIDAALTVDLPPEEAATYCATLKDAGLGTVFLASPTTTIERLKLIDEISTSFVYYISRAGVTGVQSNLSTTLDHELKQLRLNVKKPVVVGFGISNGNQAAHLAPLVDGVVVGSAFVRLFADTTEDQPEFKAALEKARLLAREIKQAIV